jgi:serine/threonine-protein kinase
MSLTTGTRLGRYEIRSQLGEGGMGEVYLAEDTQLDRKVALKILPAEVATNQERMARFVREAKAAAALNHPNIAHIYEIGEVDRQHFIAMEFVDGTTLRDKIHREQTELRKLLRYLQQVAEGLAKAHAAGIVHRDLKPDNIMVTRDGHAKILDFGLAKLIEQHPASKSAEGSSEVATAVMPQHSTPGTVMGTVGYMSPEQAQAKTVDQRSDIFSFGCILYEAATGRKPFAGDSIIDTLHKIIYEPAPAITDFNPSASPDLQRVIRKCLAKEPEKRYQTIRDSANDLEELIEEMKGVSDIERSVAPSVSATTSAIRTTDDVLAAESTVSVSQQPPSSAEYIVSGIKQHKLGAVITLLVLIVGAVGLGLYLHARTTEVAIESIAVLPFENQNHDSNTDYLADGVTESIISSLSQLSQLRVMARSTVFRYKGKDVDPQKVGYDLGVRAVLTGRLIQQGDNLTIRTELVNVSDGTELWGEQYNRKMSDLVTVQQEIARDISERLRLRLTGEQRQQLNKGSTSNTEAYQLYLKGRYHLNRQTEDGYKRSIDYFQQAIAMDPNYAQAYAGIADAYIVATDWYLPNREAMPKAKAAATRALEIDDTLAEGHVSLGTVRVFYDWNWSETDKEYRRAIKLNPNYADAHQWYSFYLGVVRGQYSEALAEAKQALQLDPLSLNANQVLADALFTARQYDQAIEQCRKTIELDQNFWWAHESLGALYERRGQFQEAIAELQKARQLDNNPLILAKLGRAYALSGKRAEAQKLIDELKELSKQRYVSSAIVAEIYAALGERDQTFEWLEKGYEERSIGMLFLKTDPLWDGFRSDPRFANLVRRVGL